MSGPSIEMHINQFTEVTFSLFRNLVFILLAVLKPRSHEADDTGITAIIESSLLIWGNKSPYLVVTSLINSG